VRRFGKWYVLDTSSEARVWTKEPRVIPPGKGASQRRGQRRTQSLVEGESRRVADVVAALPADAWRQLTVAEGSKGPRVYEYAETWVWFSEEGLPGPHERLLVRRSLDQEPELKYHRSNAAADVPLLKLAQVRGSRWTIEEDIQSGKGECGLDEYETRGWVGWHHHTTLSLLALAFLALQRERLGEKRAADDCAGSARLTHSSAGRSRLGHRRDPVMVSLASAAKSSRGRKSSEAAARRAAPEARSGRKPPQAQGRRAAPAARAK
jgi:SRSO17 transposase